MDNQNNDNETGIPMLLFSRKQDGGWGEIKQLDVVSQ